MLKISKRVFSVFFILFFVISLIAPVFGDAQKEDENIANQFTKVENDFGKDSQKSDNISLDKVSEKYIDETLQRLNDTNDSIEDKHQSQGNSTIYENEPNYSILLADQTYLDCTAIGKFNSDYDVDCYKLVINNTGELTIISTMPKTYEYLNSYLAFLLYDSNDSFLKSSSHIYTSSGSCQALIYDASPGTYYIKVFAYHDYLGLCTGKLYGLSAWMDSSNISVTGVSLNKSSINMITGGSSQKLTATVSPSNATNKNLAWASSNPSVASVSSDGEVKPLSEGNTTITVTTKDGYKTANCYVTVKDMILNRKSLKFFEAALGDCPPQGNRIYAARFPKSSTRTVNWELELSYNPPGEKVYFEVKHMYNKPDGKCDSAVSSLGDYYIESNWNNSYHTWGQGYKTQGQWSVGMYKVDIYINNKFFTTDSFEIYDDSTTGITGVSLNKSTMNLNVGQTETLIATITPANAANKEISWLSDNPSIASVDQNGKVTAVGIGTTIIKATTQDGNKTVACTVSVTDSNAQLPKLTAQSVNGITGSTLDLDIKIENINNFAGGQFEIQFDPSIVECTSIEKGEFINDFLFMSNNGQGKASLTMTNAQGISGSGVIAKLKFRLLGLAGTSSNILFKNVEFNDINGSPINISPIDSIINIAQTSTKYGDINSDDKINSVDATMILRYAVGLTTLTADQIIRADVSGDSKVNAADATLILKFAINLIDKLPIENAVGIVVASHQDGITNISAATIKAQPNSIAFVPVNYNDAVDMTSGEFTIKYDPSIAICTKVEKGSQANDFLLMVNTNNASEGTIKVALSNVSGLSGNGELLKLTFQTKTAGSASITLENIEMYNSNSQKINANSTPGKLEIQSLNDDYSNWIGNTITQNITPDKEWKIKFNKDIQESTLEGNIFVKDSSGLEYPIIVILSADKKTVTISPRNPYQTGKTYKLYINKDIKSISGEKTLKSGICMEFTISGDMEVLKIDGKTIEAQ